MEDDGNEMDSLFEGMVLFTPSQFSDQPEKHDPSHRHQDPHHHHPPPEDPPPPPVVNATLAATTPRPLDENLFSDLILVNPLQNLTEGGSSPQLTPSPSLERSISTSSSVSAGEAASTSRQVARKKKRPSGLRIGYGRDSQASPSGDRATPITVSPSLDGNSISAQDARAESNMDGTSVTSISMSTSQERESSNVASLASQQSDRSLEASEDLKQASDETLQAPLDGDDVAIQRDTEVAKEESALESKDTDAMKRDSDEREERMKVNESVEAKFDRIKTQISEKLNQARELASSLSAAKRDCVKKRRKAAENVNLASVKYRELEKCLEEACEAEDFEMAEKLSESLAAADKERQTLMDLLRASEAESDAIDAKMQEVLNGQIGVEEECVSLLEDFSKDATTIAELIIEKANLMCADEMDKWFSLSEAVEAKKMEFEIESCLINEACKVLNGSIEHSVDDDKREKEELLRKKSVLLDELQRLLALVKEKEKEIAENDANIEAVEKRIAGVVSEFHDVQLDIGAKYDRVKSNLSQVDVESQALLMKKKDIDDSFSQEESKGAQLRLLGKIAADEAKTYHEVAGLRKGLMLSILEFRENKLGLVRTEDKYSEDVQRLQQEASTARASLQELSSTKSSLQQEIASCEQRILFMDKRLPELETEKKVAAAARNFKEAARIAAEAKSLNIEKEGIQAKLERATSALGKLEEEIRETVNRLQEAEEQILLKEKDVAVARFRRLLITARAANAERAAVLELGDDEEATLLLAEAEAAESEAKKLQEIYDFKVEEFGDQPKQLIPMELVSDLGREQLAELVKSIDLVEALR